MNKMLLIGILLIVGIAVFMLMGNQTNNSNNQTPSITEQPTSPTIRETAQEEVVSVTLTNSGFEPKEINIKVGSKVVWKNSSGRVATVNSDLHPTHRLYQALNLGQFQDNATVELVFDKAGTFTYHNHLNSGHTGSITVE